MNFIIAYFKGIWHVMKSGKVVVIHYLALLILALLATLPFMRLMDAKVGNSMAIEKLLPDFDYTVYKDFVNATGVDSAFAAIGNMGIGLLVLFFILSIFLTGGVLKIYKNAPERFSLQSFFAGCTYYFWRLLRMTIYFLMVHVAVGALFSFIYTKMIGGGFDDFGSEVGYIDVIIKVGAVYLFVAAWFFMVHDYAKIDMVHRDRTLITRSFWGAFPLVLRNFFNTLLLYMLNALTFAGIVVLYFYLSKMIMTDTPQGIALALVLGQAFVIARIAVRLLNMASATLVYKGIMAKRNKKIRLAEEAEEARLQAIRDAEEEAIRMKKAAADAEYQANIAARKAKLAGEAAAALGTSQIAEMIQTETEQNLVDTDSSISTENPIADIPPTERDALNVVKPPSIITDLFDEEE